MTTLARACARQAQHTNTVLIRARSKREYHSRQDAPAVTRAVQWHRSYSNDAYIGDALSRLEEAAQQARRASPRESRSVKEGLWDGNEDNGFPNTSEHHTVYQAQEKTDLRQPRSIKRVFQRLRESISAGAGYSSTGAAMLNTADLKHPTTRDKGDYLDHQILINFDYDQGLREGLEAGAPDLCFKSILAAKKASDNEFLQSITMNEFSEILQIMHPRSLLGNLLHIHSMMDEKIVARFGVMSIEGIVAEWTEAILKLLEIRRSSKQHLALADYESLFSAAKMLHNRELASSLWEVLRLEGLSPSIACYNGYCGAVIWERGLTAKSRRHERRGAWNERRRTRYRLPLYLNFRIAQGGAYELAQQIYGEAISKELQLDTESYCNMILAAGMEGDVEFIGSRLSEIWNVDMIQADREERPKSMNAMMESWDPLYPTAELIHSLVYACCINSDIINALHLANHFSQEYDLPIPKETWIKLLDFTLEMTYSKPANDITLKTDTRLPSVAMDEIWKIMSSPPNEVQARASMFDCYLKQLWDDCKPRAFLDLARIGLQCVEQTRSRAKESASLLKAATSTEESSAIIEHLSRENELNWLEWKQAKALAKDWLIRYLTLTADAIRTDCSAEISTVAIPTAVGEWLLHTPRHVEYETSTGHVRLEMWAQEDYDFFVLYKLMKLYQQRQDSKEQERILDAEWSFGGDRPELMAVAGRPGAFEKETEVFDPDDLEPVWSVPTAPPRYIQRKEWFAQNSKS